LNERRKARNHVCPPGRGVVPLSSLYELIGRLVVRLAWWRFGRQIQIAGVVALAAAVAGGYLLSRREPPEG